MIIFNGYSNNLDELVFDTELLISDIINDNLVSTHTTIEQAMSPLELELSYQYNEARANLDRADNEINNRNDTELNGATKALDNIFEGSDQFIKGEYQDAWATHSTSEQDIIDLMRLEFGNMADNLTVSDGQVTGSIEDIQRGLDDKFNDVLDDIWGFLSGKDYDLGGVLDGIASDIANAFTNTLDWIWEKLEAGFSVIRDLGFAAVNALISLPLKLASLNDIMGSMTSINEETYVEDMVRFAALQKEAMAKMPKVE